MSQPNPIYEIDDLRSFDENLATFANALTAVDPILGPVLAANVSARLGDKITRAELWELLANALEPETSA